MLFRSSSGLSSHEIQVPVLAASSGDHYVPHTTICKKDGLETGMCDTFHIKRINFFAS